MFCNVMFSSLKKKQPRQRLLIASWPCCPFRQARAIEHDANDQRILLAWNLYRCLEFTFSICNTSYLSAETFFKLNTHTHQSIIFF